MAQLQIDYLSTKKRLKDVREALIALPKSVFEFYDDSLLRMELLEEEDRHFSQKVLSYVFHARRPLSLSELLHALSVDLESTELETSDLYDKLLIFSVTFGFVRVDSKTNHMRLAHQTLDEYLKTRPPSFLATNERSLATACMTYLTFAPFAAGPCLQESDMLRRLDNYCFLEYASRYWSQHANACMDKELGKMALAFLNDDQKLASCVQVLYLDQRRVAVAWYATYPKGFTSLHAVAYWGLHCLFEDILREYDNINLPDSQGNTPIILSAKNHHFLLLKRLLESGGNANLHNTRGENALLLAAMMGHREIVELLLAHGASLLTKDYEGWTPLHWAIIHRHNDAVTSLLDATTHSWADKELQYNKALILAAEAGNHVVVQMLLQNGAAVDYQDAENSTALHWAVSEGHLETTRVLLLKGADPNSVDVGGNVPLHWAVPYPAITRLLKEHGSKVNVSNHEKQSPLLWAVFSEQLNTVQTLIELGANVNQADARGITPLHAAALRGHEELVLWLLDHGADINRVDHNGWTALHAASYAEKLQSSDLLKLRTRDGHEIVGSVSQKLEDPDVRALIKEMIHRKSSGSVVVSGLRAVINNRHNLRLLAMLERGANINAEDEISGYTALTYSADSGEEEIVRLLLEQGADANIPERSGFTALHYAARLGSISITKLLVETGKAAIDTKVFGWTPMLIAARNCEADCIIYLLERGADIHAQDFHGRTALHWSCMYGDKLLADHILRLGANMEAEDRRGQNALHWAVANESLGIAKLLLYLGANPTSRTQDGSTALHFAAFTGQLELVELLCKGPRTKRSGKRKDWAKGRKQTRSGQERFGGAANNVDGALIDMTANMDGFTALDIAILVGRQDIARFLAECYSQIGGTGMPPPDQTRVIASQTKHKLSSKPPTLRLGVSDEHDHLHQDQLGDGLGKPIFDQVVRTWLLERQRQIESSGVSSVTSSSDDHCPLKADC